MARTVQHVNRRHPELNRRKGVHFDSETLSFGGQYITECSNLSLGREFRLAADYSQALHSRLKAPHPLIVSPINISTTISYYLAI